MNIFTTLSHIGYVIHRVPSRFGYGVGVYSIAIGKPVQKRGMPEAELSV
jgi:hypothetical protein